MIKVGILTISDTRKKNSDLSGKLIKKMLSKNKQFNVQSYAVVHDDKKQIKNKLIQYADVLRLNLVLTNGGTGLSPRDITPEVTLEILDKSVPGISELIRIEGMKKTRHAILSRGVAGTRKNTLIINLPGSPKGVEESLTLILGIIPHAIEMLGGKGH